MSRLLLVLMVLACMGGGEGWAGSVGVPSQASVTVPPIGRITLPGAGLSGREVTIGVKLAGVGEARGQWAELGEPVPVLVHSNVPWRVRVWVSDPQWAGAVAVRVGGGPYRVVGDGGTVLTCGGPGAHAMVVHFRVDLSLFDGNPGRVVPLVCRIEG